MSSDEAHSSGLTVPLFGVLTCVGLYFIRRYMKGAQFVEHVKATSKIALITGASAGIGKQTARELNLRGAIVYMLCRSEQKAEAVKVQLTKLGCDPTRLFVRHVDLANFATVRKFADEMSKEVNKIDILVNNAGIMFYPKFDRTVDGHEMTWQSNYLGHFLLTELLMPLLHKSEHARVINVSSSLHKRADTIELSVVNNPKKFGKLLSYARSKLANVMHARELTKRLRAKNPQSTMTFNSVHPGVCFTELMRYSVFNTTPIRQLITPILWFFMKTEKDGAQTTLYLALSKDVESVSGKYFGECQQHDPAPNALDDDVCTILFNQSLEAVGLSK